MVYVAMALLGAALVYFWVLSLGWAYGEGKRAMLGQVQTIVKEVREGRQQQ